MTAAATANEPVKADADERECLFFDGAFVVAKPVGWTWGKQELQPPFAVERVAVGAESKASPGAPLQAVDGQATFAAEEKASAALAEFSVAELTAELARRRNAGPGARA